MNELTYLGSIITNINTMSREFKRKTVLTQRCYYSLSRQLSSRDLPCITNVLPDNSGMDPVKIDATALRVFERRIVCEILPPICVDDDFHIITNKELYYLLNDINVAQRIKVQEQRWLGRAVRMEEHVPCF